MRFLASSTTTTTAILAVLGTTTTTIAQQTSAYTDAATGITFQAFNDPATGYTFGIALPTTPSADFIGQLVAKGSGWVGLSLAGPMTNSLLLAAWPNSQQVLSSFRQTTGHNSPPEITGTFSTSAITKGTSVNATHFTYTFLCRSCVSTNSTLTFAAAADSASLGWALNTAAPNNKATPKTATFTKHGAQGKFTANLKAARSDSFATWAAMADGSGSSMTTVATPPVQQRARATSW